MRLLRFPPLRALLGRGVSVRSSGPIIPLTRTSPSSARSNTRLFSHFPARLSSDSARPSSDQNSSSQTLSQRLKHLIKSYGWYALGVYVVISTLDFSVAFAAINILGAEQVSHVANSVKQAVKDMIYSRPSEPGRDEIDAVNDPAGAAGSEGLYAMILLAYTVHKTLFLPIRVGLTAWLTPRLVGWLRTKGWAGSEGTKRAAAEMREKIRSRRRSQSRD